jgi:hypothetical protein
MRFPVERSMTVSAPQRSDRRSLSTSSSSEDVVGELPMFALIFTRTFSPMAIGSSAWWWTFAGMIIRPRATSARTSSGSSDSRSATRSISGDTVPARARCICVRQDESGENVVRYGTVPPFAGMSQIRFVGSAQGSALSAPRSGTPRDMRDELEATDRRARVSSAACLRSRR